jgi:glycine cleavage system H lipoate-binding protein
MQVKYTQDHQYIIVEDGVGTVGITNHAQEKLSDVTTVELPHLGAQVRKGGAVGVIESRLVGGSSPPSPTTQSCANGDFPVQCE